MYKYYDDIKEAFKNISVKKTLDLKDVDIYFITNTKNNKK